ncbi:hypothetical protein ACCO45_003138 [Purpureocillium lilacinum]|uniref:Uncharacterized protein n=1 Tax=Purpureocillium lilacinum TaxID=33203 RepID=A0ACC4DZ32_PURLI
MTKGFPSWLIGSRFVVAASQPPRIAGGFMRGKLPLSPSRLSPSATTVQRSPAHRSSHSLSRPSFVLEHGILLSRRAQPPSWAAAGITNERHGRGPIAASIWRLQHRAYASSERQNTPKPNPERQPTSVAPGDKHAKPATGQEDTASPETEAESIAASVSKYLHLPKMPHRPSKEELLAAANGFWERVRVRFKWMSIRSMRPWNADEWGPLCRGSCLATWCGFLSEPLQTLAKWVGDYLTQSAGVTVVFESAIVPKWKNGVIAFRNVFVSRRPGQVESSVSKGSSDAAAVAAAGRQAQLAGSEDTEDDGNYTQFDVTIANVNVTLSFINWWSGKGLLKDVEQIDPLSYRHTHEPGDFEIESFKLEDLLLTIHQPDGFRPFSVSIYSCELPQLRKQWLFYDFLSASHMSGSFDGSLFTIHPRQVHGVVSSNGQGAMLGVGEPSAWKKFSRLRIDGLKIDHLNRGVEGPFGWIYEGNVDIVADVMFPADTDEGITKVMSDFYDQLEEAVISNRARFLQKAADTAPDILRSGHLSEASGQALDEHPAEDGSNGEQEEEDRRYLIMDMRIHLNDVKAAVPLFTRDISYINQALVRPIVAYINAKKTYIPIACRIVKRLNDFDGSWTVFDCGLMDDASAETYEAFAKDVEDQQSRVRRFKKVGFWTLSLAVHALFMGMAGNVV